MKRLTTLVLLALAGFYVAWPVWSAYRIATALTNEDEALVESKVDFPSVRESLKPAAMAEVGKGIDKGTGALGPMAQVLGGNVKQQMTGAVIEQMLAAAVTPRSVIRLAKDGGDFASALQKTMADAGGSLGGSVSGSAPAAGALAGALGQVVGGLRKPEAVAQSESTQAKASDSKGNKRTFGLGNVKGFRMAGPLGFDIDVARDATQPKPDVTVGMSFTGGDWKLARIVPAL